MVSSQNHVMLAQIVHPLNGVTQVTVRLIQPCQYVMDAQNYLVCLADTS